MNASVMQYLDDERYYTPAGPTESNEEEAYCQSASTSLNKGAGVSPVFPGPPPPQSQRAGVQLIDTPTPEWSASRSEQGT
jgi:hypothetical protein